MPNSSLTDGLMEDANLLLLRGLRILSVNHQVYPGGLSWGNMVSNPIKSVVLHNKWFVHLWFYHKLMGAQLKAGAKPLLKVAKKTERLELSRFSRWLEPGIPYFPSCLLSVWWLQHIKDAYIQYKSPKVDVSMAILEAPNCASTLARIFWISACVGSRQLLPCARCLFKRDHVDSTMATVAHHFIHKKRRYKNVALVTFCPQKVFMAPKKTWHRRPSNLWKLWGWRPDPLRPVTNHRRWLARKCLCLSSSISFQLVSGENHGNHFHVQSKNS